MNLMLPTYTKKQINANRKKWLKALRSGEYKQGKCHLHTFNKKGETLYCCLGVACEVAIKSKVDVQVLENNYEDPAGLLHNRYNGQTGVMPKAVTNWLGLATNGGDFYEEGKPNRTYLYSLTELNDGKEGKRGKNFKQIADIVEKNWEALEKGRQK